MRLNELLAASLPPGDEFEILHLHSVPTETYPIITPKPGEVNKLITVKSQHFFSLFQNSKTVFGLEVYVYITLNKKIESDAVTDLNMVYDAERLIFISKADTTGYFDKKLNIKLITSSIIRYLLSIDPNYYLKNVKPMKRSYKGQYSKCISKSTSTVKALRLLSKRVNLIHKDMDMKKNLCLHFKCNQDIVTKISLFTRPAAQYLFSESSRNHKKHILTGEELLIWWISIIDNLLIEEYNDRTNAKLQIPGEEPQRIQKYIRELRYSNWKVGDIFGNSNNSLAGFKIPLFPDDPKSRFLHQLVEENRIYNTNLENFWMELQERQEFKSGVTVSVIGISGHLKSVSTNIPQDNEIIKTRSKNHFKYIKNYINGEEYDTEEGAYESYLNVKDYLSRTNGNLLPISGNYIYSKPTKAANQEVIITMLQPRKKK